MPLFVPAAEIEQRERENQRMAERLLEIDGMKPIIDLAYTLRDEITTVLDTHPELSTKAIGELAFRAALEDQVSRAREDLVAEYEQVHRTVLYERVLEEVKLEEGDDISELVRLQVETDPALAIELRDSARRELAARAMHDVTLAITAEQQKVIDAEAERQIKLDKLDVELASSGVLTPQGREVVDLLKPGDTVRLYFEPIKGKTREHFELRWEEDVQGDMGWVYVGSSDNVSWSDKSGYTTTVDTKRFAMPSTMHFDGRTGDSVPEVNRLRVGMRPLIGRVGKKSGKQSYLYPTVKSGSRSYDSQPGILSGSDFRTKTLNFYS